MTCTERAAEWTLGEQQICLHHSFRVPQRVVELGYHT
jgi:hypothetical protein